MKPVSVVILAKGNSERIPRKNLADWRGKPLLLWAIEYALSEGFTPYVLTEDAEIKDYAIRCGANVIDEPVELTHPRIKSMPVLQWMVKILKTNLIVLQCTAPLREPGQLREMNQMLEHFDTVYTGARLPAPFILDQQGTFVNRPFCSDGAPPLTNDIENDPQWIMTGSMYGLTYPEILKHNYILYGKIGVLESPWDLIRDIDYPEQLERPSVVVVGNATNLKDRKLGWLIDEYDVVVRSNLYRTEGFETSVGSRTTHWTVVCTSQILEMLPDTDCSQYTEVWARHFENDEDYANVCQNLSNFKKLKRVSHRDNTPNFPRWLEDRHRLNTPTTGFVSIVEAINRWGPVIDIAGFGSADQFKSGYYWSGKVNFASYHDYDEERLILNEWEQSGFIRRIDQ